MTSEIYKIGSCFTAGSLFEVCVSPSPGLVSPFDSGAHTDMNIFTFMLGSSILAPYFTECVEAGWHKSALGAEVVFAHLRTIGLRAEGDLLGATNGVNTQRGQLFVLGLAAGITGFCMARRIAVPSPEFFGVIRSACHGLTARELGGLVPGESTTAGERLFLAGGHTGVRGEAEAGFPTVEHIGYPALLEALGRGLSLNDAAVHALINLMAQLSDTTVLHRAGERGLSQVRATARDVLSAGSVFSHVGRMLINEAHAMFSAQRLSPGGSGDLLALTLSLYFLGEGFPTPDVLLRPTLFVR